MGNRDAERTEAIKDALEKFIVETANGSRNSFGSADRTSVLAEVTMAFCRVAELSAYWNN